MIFYVILTLLPRSNKSNLFKRNEKVQKLYFYPKIKISATTQRSQRAER